MANCLYVRDVEILFCICIYTHFIREEYVSFQSVAMEVVKQKMNVSASGYYAIADKLLPPYFEIFGSAHDVTYRNTVVLARLQVFNGFLRWNLDNKFCLKIHFFFFFKKFKILLFFLVNNVTNDLKWSEEKFYLYFINKIMEFLPRLSWHKDKACKRFHRRNGHHVQKLLTCQ